MFDISTFKTTIEVNDWRAVLAHWLRGDSLSEINEKQLEVAQFIEADIIYRLVWGIEAARVYEMAQGNLTAEQIGGLATAALEAGTLNRSAAIVLRSGFEHRSAAIKAVTDTGGSFEDATGMRAWVRELDPALAADPTWPTQASHDAWGEFTRKLRQRRRRRWSQHTVFAENVEWGDTPVDPGEWLRVTRDDAATVGIWSPGFDRLATVPLRLTADRQGVLHAWMGRDGRLRLRYRGPDDWLASDDRAGE